MSNRLRILHVIVQPVVVVDSGDELAPGPEIQPVTIPVARLAELAGQLPGELEAMQREYDAQAEPPA